jgi:hypothetical protein
MEKPYVSALLCFSIRTQKGSLLLLLLAAVFLTSLVGNNTGSAAILCSFQSPISPVSPVIGPSEPAARPAVTPTSQPSVPAVPPSAVSTPVFWIVIGLVVVGTFVMGLVFFQKRGE